VVSFEGPTLFFNSQKKLARTLEEHCFVSYMISFIQKKKEKEKQKILIKIIIKEEDTHTHTPSGQPAN
jgi:hypothetical protein